jgi:group I intron endonuclease
MQVYGYVYLVRNQVNGKVYIGQTILPLITRFRQHLSAARRGRTTSRLYSSIRTHGEHNFVIRELHRAFSPDELNEMEIRAIWSHDSTDRVNGYNGTIGGDGFRPTEETRAKLKANNAMTGRTHSEETRARMRHAHSLLPSRKGIPVHTEELKQFISKINKGRKHTPEECARMSAGRTGMRQSAETKEKRAAYHRGVKRSPQACLNMRLGRQRKRAERAALAEKEK